jgi:hypothetical protein
VAGRRRRGRGAQILGSLLENKREKKTDLTVSKCSGAQETTFETFGAGGEGGGIYQSAPAQMAQMPTLNCLQRGVYRRRGENPTLPGNPSKRILQCPCKKDDRVVHQMGCTLNHNKDTTQDATRQDKTRHKTRQGKASQDKTQQNKTRQNITRIIEKEQTKLLLFFSERVRMHQGQFCPASEADQGGRLGWRVCLIRNHKM